MIDTTNVAMAVEATKHQSPLTLAMHFIALEFNLDVHFLESLSTDHQTEIYESIALLEALPRNK